MDHLEVPDMRKSRGVLLPPASAGRVRRRDLYRALRTAVLDGVLAPGERLPSSRQAGADYRVSRGMVEGVYGQLTVEGFLDRTVGRGTSVAGCAARLVSPATRGAGERHSPAASRRGRMSIFQSPKPNRPHTLANTGAGGLRLTLPLEQSAVRPGFLSSSARRGTSAE